MLLLYCNKTHTKLLQLAKKRNPRRRNAVDSFKDKAYNDYWNDLDSEDLTTAAFLECVGNLVGKKCAYLKSKQYIIVFETIVTTYRQYRWVKYY